MPIYIYHCSNCDFEFEHSQKFSDPHLKRCPECGKLTLNKMFTPATVIYKGSGFYSTDHRSSSGSTPTSSPKKKEEKNPEKKTETASEPAKTKEVPTAKKEE